MTTVAHCPRNLSGLHTWSRMRGSSIDVCRCGATRRGGVVTTPRQRTPAASRVSDPETSHEAERRVTSSGRRQTIAERVYTYVDEHPGQTRGEIADGLGLRQDQVWRRLSDLKSAGRLVPGIPMPYEGHDQSTWYSYRHAMQAAAE